MRTNGCVRKGYSQVSDPARAVQELCDRISQPDASLGVFFCSSEFDRAAVEAELSQRFAGINLIGCTSAAEITPEGYLSGSIVGFTLASPDFAAVSAPIYGLKDFSIADGKGIVDGLRARLDGKAQTPDDGHTFAFLLIDGLCMCEEVVVSSLHAALGKIPLFGASSGGNLDFRESYVYFDGAFRTDAAVLTLIRTRHPFKLFTTDHFVSAGTKMVVTEAVPAERIVTEINAEPAGYEYARLVGLDLDHLKPMSFASHPVVVKVGGRYYTRSIQKVNEDGSLSFFCAIDKGVVLTVARATDILKNLSDCFGDIRREIGPLQLVIGCDCVLRTLELEQRQLKGRAGRMLKENNVIGFATFGEEFGAMHVNQTFTGAAIGSAVRAGE
ncbi:MAG: FIST C-terminal domain-containing protein [Rhodospirillales bacterium]|nr:FIST C-terminal domain-containing protein [Rhodospirillales bacterium]